jgi:hypothetical protein
MEPVTSINVSKTTFQIGDSALNLAFKDYLRRSVQNRIKFYIIFIAIFAILGILEGHGLFIMFNITYLVTGLVGWYVSARHLWTVDYFILLFSLEISLGGTFKYLHLESMREEEDKRSQTLLMMFGIQIMFQSFLNCNFVHN